MLPHTSTDLEGRSSISKIDATTNAPLETVAGGWSGRATKDAPAVIRRILTHLGLSLDPGEPAQKRAPPTWVKWTSRSRAP